MRRCRAAAPRGAAAALTLRRATHLLLAARLRGAEAADLSTFPRPLLSTLLRSLVYTQAKRVRRSMSAASV